MMQYRLKQSGFSLIELLVVIAIIGLLTAVTFASVNAMRQKGNDNLVRGQLSIAQTRAGELYTDNSCYATDATCASVVPSTCTNTAGTLFADDKVWLAVSAAIKASGSAVASAVSACATTASAGGRPYSYAIVVRLISSRTSGKHDQAWCVDSKGAAKLEGTAGVDINSATIIKSFISTAGGTVSCL